MSRSEISFCSIPYKNPVLSASGTFGWGYEFSEFYDVNQLGAVTLKSITLEERLGNPAPRVCEFSTGMLNSIGLQNPGLESFLKDVVPELEQRLTTHVHASVAGESQEEFVALTKALSSVDVVGAIELNVSCPNMKNHHIPFATDVLVLSSLVKACRKQTRKPLIVKLSPNVTDIRSIAKTCEEAGADALSLINTLLGMRIDIQTRRPMIDRVVGGYSGPGIKPVALRMIYEASRAVSIPIIGVGGVSSYEDVVEFLLAGATLVSVGTANLFDPTVACRIVKDLEKYLDRNNFSAPSLVKSIILPQ